MNVLVAASGFPCGLDSALPFHAALSALVVRVFGSFAVGEKPGSAAFGIKHSTVRRVISTDEAQKKPPTVICLL